MKLPGLHHVTMITGDAQRNVAFYAGVLGLRLVKKTVNFDDPTAYHLYYGDEVGTPGSILTWFEYSGARRGRSGAGMVHTIQLGVPSAAAFDFWESRLAESGYAASRVDGGLRFEDWEGLRLELVPTAGGNRPLVAAHREIPTDVAITGIEGARAFTSYASVEEPLLTGSLGFAYEGNGEYRLSGDERSFRWVFDQAEGSGQGGAGTVHHIAWASRDEDHVGWQQTVREAGGFVTDVLDRDYFRSIYFREPRGILYEIATLSPGFAVDEAPDHLGEELRVPRMHAHLRERLERELTPLVNPRAAQS